MQIFEFAHHKCTTSPMLTFFSWRTTFLRDEDHENSFAGETHTLYREICQMSSPNGLVQIFNVGFSKHATHCKPPSKPSNYQTGLLWACMNIYKHKYLYIYVYNSVYLNRDKITCIEYNCASRAEVLKISVLPTVLER